MVRLYAGVPESNGFRQHQTLSNTNALIYYQVMCLLFFLLYNISFVPLNCEIRATGPS